MSEKKIANIVPVQMTDAYAISFGMVEGKYAVNKYLKLFLDRFDAAEKDGKKEVVLKIGERLEKGNEREREIAATILYQLSLKEFNIDSALPSLFFALRKTDGALENVFRTLDNLMSQPYYESAIKQGLPSVIETCTKDELSNIKRWITYIYADKTLDASERRFQKSMIELINDTGAQLTKKGKKPDDRLIATNY
ncbi:hypothetical protein KJ780_02945 [Candidatus Micrarchaeota archaeon]|nr:hypothetical protein [Candidatus Micrarchaeota archaeon]